MPNYRRYLVSNIPYFVTTNVRERAPIFADLTLCTVMLKSLAWCQTNMGFALLAYVIMPDHLHLIIVPSDKTSLPDIMRRLKSFTAKTIGERFNSQGGIWQERYYERAMRRASDLEKAIEYIHNNPVAAQLVESPSNYEFSSYNAYFGAPAGTVNVDVDWMIGKAEVAAAGQEPRPTVY